jgi:hypothetical protein
MAAMAPARKTAQRATEIQVLYRTDRRLLSSPKIPKCPRDTSHEPAIVPRV